jgi:hypothetical protein
MKDETKSMLIAVFLGIFSFCCLCFLILTMLGAFKSEYYGFRSFKGENFSLKYPKDWIVSEGAKDENILELMEFKIPKVDMPEAKRPLGVIINVYENHTEFKNKSLIDIAEIFNKELEENKDKIKMISQTELQLDNDDALRQVLLIETKEITLKLRQFILIKDSKVFVINYIVPEKKYGEYFDYMEKLVNSFEIKNR